MGILKQAPLSPEDRSQGPTGPSPIGIVMMASGE